jgi:hypothetical protein
MLFLQGVFCKRFQELGIGTVLTERRSPMHTNANFLDIAGFVGALSAERT